ncbi:DNA gyrase subunit A [Planctomycetes bacterium Pan216]|uniref:DNA topoisomerase (ATP-hydrolyzing) n=1 Tax=Kolteria novifilia TaxID=2527975 RepID=A0A518BC46_9BACT|nr:DNA gyrase subunit A [Planctomycetes bacterium Pan216]
MDESIELINIADETKRRYLNYALSVIQSRALPDARDGLKPVQRRILFAMRQEGYRADSRCRKCVGVTGEVTKSYHPHGDQPVYDALVRLAQDFTLRYPLVHGEGNFGSVDGDPPAAMRYTECRMMPLAERMMDELVQQTVDMRPNFDGEKEEPVVLPAQFPELLTNGSTGIAVGMATNIPPHNLGELIRACLLLIGNREATTAQLVNAHRGPIKGPDFPLGGRMLVDQPTLRKIYETGQGPIKVQGEWKIEKVGKGRTKDRQIIIHSIPYGVNKGNLLASIGDIVAQRRLPQVTNLVDESSLDNGMRIVLELKEGTNPEVVMAYLFKHTALQENFACNFTCLMPTDNQETQEDVQPRRVGVKEILLAFLDFRFLTVRRRFEFLLEQLLKRIHILEGFRIIFDDLDTAIEIIKKSKGRLDAAERLRDHFPLDEVQSLAIVDLNLYRIGSLEIKKVVDELREKKKEAKRIEDILASDKKLWAEVHRELSAFAETYADSRRTKIADEEQTPEFDPEAYIVRENANVVLTRKGWIKRVGRLSSIKSTRVRDGDEVLVVLPGSTLDCVVLFSSDGFAYTMRIDEVPVSSGYGEPLAKFFRLRDGVTIVGAATTDSRFTPTGQAMPPRRSMFMKETEEWQLVVATRSGNILRTALAPFGVPSTKAGRRYVRLTDNSDEVVFVGVPTIDDETMFLAASDGHVIHFHLSDVNVLSGVGKGVKGIKMEDKVSCIGGQIVSGFREAMKVETTRGSELELRRGKYQPTGRGGKGHEVIKRGGLVRVIPIEASLVDWSSIADAD